MAEVEPKEARAVERTENATGLKDESYIYDNIAGDYVDPNLQITPEEDRRLRRKMWRKYVSIPWAHLRGSDNVC